MQLISRERLVTAMAAADGGAGISVRRLADACPALALRPDGHRSHSMIQQLRSGRRNTCSLLLGLQIAEALDVAHDTLFRARTSSSAGQSVPDDSRTDPTTRR